MEINQMEALEYLVEVGKEIETSREKPIIEVVKDRTYLFYQGRRDEIQPKDPPAPDTTELYTLEGLCEFIDCDVDHIFHGTDRYIVRVASHERVEVLSPLTDVERRRSFIAYCNAKLPRIHFDQFIDAESFIVMVMSRFEKTENRDLMLSIVGNLKSEESINQADDGFSQRITIRKGIIKCGETTVENPIPLKPFRTFNEIEQPESLFTLRFREGGEVALFESDGGAWKNEAVYTIRDWLQERLARSAAKVVVIA